MSIWRRHLSRRAHPRPRQIRRVRGLRQLRVCRWVLTGPLGQLAPLVLVARLGPEGLAAPVAHRPSTHQAYQSAGRYKLRTRPPAVRAARCVSLRSPRASDGSLKHALIVASGVGTAIGPSAYASDRRWEAFDFATGMFALGWPLWWLMHQATLGAILASFIAVLGLPE